MPRFFLDHVEGSTARLVGEDARHIARSLRMTPGRELTLCDAKGTDYRCEITHIDFDFVEVKVLESTPCASECPVRVHLYQALPKGDKLALIVQKAVELGAASVTPVLTSRCISRPSHKAFEKKRARLQKIAHEAAKQSGRGLIPTIGPLMTFEQAIDEMTEYDLKTILYEESETPLREVFQGTPRTAALLVGSEGGFARSEVDFARAANVPDASLGKRILRCETAPVCALSALFFYLGEF